MRFLHVFDRIVKSSGFLWRIHVQPSTGSAGISEGLNLQPLGLRSVRVFTPKAGGQDLAFRNLHYLIFGVRGGRGAKTGVNGV